jgi:hypothetical protein
MSLFEHLTWQNGALGSRDLERMIAIAWIDRCIIREAHGAPTCFDSAFELVVALEAFVGRQVNPQAAAADKLVDVLVGVRRAECGV